MRFSNLNQKAFRDFYCVPVFFDRLTASLCDVVLDSNESASLLEQLERDNLFITQLENSGKRLWYRYNPLFAEAIQQLARTRLSESEIQSIFEKSSIWYETQGQLDEAIETALAADLLERVIDLVEKFIEIHDITELYTLGRWLENIPDELLKSHPKVCFFYAQVILYTSDRFSPTSAIRIEPLLLASEKNLARIRERTGTWPAYIVSWHGGLVASEILGGFRVRTQIPGSASRI